MIKGTPGEWYQDNHIGGYFNQFGELVVCEEYDLADLDTDKYAVDVQNCDGYYNKYGMYVLKKSNIIDLIMSSYCQIKKRGEKNRVSKIRPNS